MTRDAITEALWKKVLDDFDSDKVHEAFLTHCRIDGRLLDAARHYRERKETLPEDDKPGREKIDKRLAAIAILAMAELDVRRTEPRKSHLMLMLRIMAVVVAIFSSAVLVYALSQLKFHL